MPACNLYKYVDPPTEDITIANVDPILLENQRILLRNLSDNLCISPPIGRVTKEEHRALLGIINMLDAWSDARHRNKN